MKTTIQNTAQLAALLPELPARDKFRSKIEDLLGRGHTIELCIAELGLSYRSKATGKRYKAKLVAGGRSFYLKETRLERVGMTEEMAATAQVIEKGRVWGKIGEVETFEYLVERTNLATWARIAKLVGELLKESIVAGCTCPKCGGTGRIPEFGHIENGLCFKCIGIGLV